MHLICLSQVHNTKACGVLMECTPLYCNYEPLCESNLLFLDVISVYSVVTSVNKWQLYLPRTKEDATLLRPLAGNAVGNISQMKRTTWWLANHPVIGFGTY